MAKTTHPERQERSERRRERQPAEFEEHVLEVARVTRVVKGGRRLRFRATVVIGNKQGKVGLGIGKANEVRSAVDKAVSQARKTMLKVPLVGGTIPHEIDYKFKAARVRLVPASPGTGLIVGGAMRAVLEAAGVKDILGKRFGTRNPVVNAQAAMRALKRLRPIEREAKESKEAKEAKEENVKEGSSAVAQ
jgi:small subunit ribosomal protein S5